MLLACIGLHARLRPFPKVASLQRVPENLTSGLMDPAHELP